ncbi:pyridine nucleotide-disulfide oxidoreductase/dicluster-binding protein [Anaerovorax odorimutans]|uniref:pyridine nucleotide-disulfide oxidoreductase/dicluster-binding protein n=1 Tax=Anaerovorax odorimutans TaxID=109327 RepID=UPI0004016905|nr:pyridine nucleotide-disulfide oxidoreductase/dicluster-binding protein [Anaerovorax odorimutans]
MDKNLFEECEKCIQDEPAASTAWCPVHVDVALLNSEIEKGDFRKAYRVLEKKIPFAAIICSICDHPCEKVCVRNKVDQAINISELERAVVHYGYKPFKKGVLLPKKNGTAVVIGGGISGIITAFELDKKGFQVTIYEQSERLGGRIWDYKGILLDEDIINEELQIINKLGIKVNYNKKITEDGLEELIKEYDAVYLGTGEWKRELNINPETFQVLNLPIFAGGRLYNKNDSVIYSVSSGKRAAVSMERYIKKISLTASRDREGSYETPLKYNLDDVKPNTRIEKTDKIYTEEEAIKEAGRCLKCRCIECFKACSHMQKFNITPKSYARQIQINENVIMGTRYANKMINSCTMCGLCKEQCFLDIGMKDLIHQTRENMVEKNKMPPSAHDFALSDMEFSNSKRFFMVKSPPPIKGTNKIDYIFYPGCQLAASYPEYVEKSYKYLISQIEGVGIMLGCCGAPADWAGRKDLMNESIERFKNIWLENGKPVFIFACSSCIGIFEKYLPEISYISLWQIFEKYGLPKKVNSEYNHVLNIHDACSTRYNKEVQESIRNIVLNLGYEIDELKYSKAKTKCCGYGGLVYYANKEQAKEFAEDRINESKEDLLVYCSMCKDIFVDKGKRTFHILDLIFGEDMEKLSLKKMPNLSERHSNRASLKNKLLRELWEEEPETDLQKNDMDLVISKEIWNTMEDRFILFEDIEKVIRHSQISKERFFNSLDSSYLANLRIKNVTYWVRYKEKEDGIYIVSVYSHRMEIAKE